MKIAYITEARIPTEKAHGLQIMKMCEAFARAGADVEFIAPRRRNALNEDPFDYYGVERIFSITYLPTIDLIGIIPRFGLWLHSFLFSIALCVHLFRKDFDVVYSRNNISLFFLSFMHASLWWEPHVGSWNFITRRVLKKVEGIIAITTGGKEFFVSKGVSGGDILVAHDGVDIAQFDVEVTKMEARERLGLAQNSYIAMYIGLFDEWKGFRTLLDAAPSLSHAGVQVVMIGGTQKQVDSLKAEYPHVNFTGYKPYRELPVNQKAADVLVLPNSAKSEVSIRFTSPLKLFAYMASGRPIVATDIPTLRDVLKDGENALLVEPDSPEALAQGVLSLIHEPALTARLAAHAFKDVQGHTWQKRAERIIHFIETHG